MPPNEIMCINSSTRPADSAAQPLLSALGAADESEPRLMAVATSPNRIRAASTSEPQMEASPRGASEPEGAASDEGDDEGGATDGGGYERAMQSDQGQSADGAGATSEPEHDARWQRRARDSTNVGVQSAVTGYSSDTTPRSQFELARDMQLQAARVDGAMASRLPRASHLARAPIAFGGATRRSNTDRGPPRTNAPTARPTSRPAARRAERADAHHRLRNYVEEDDDERPDPLIWTGGSPPPVQPLQPAAVPASAFSLPPLLASMALNGTTSSFSHDRTKILRCTSYCVAIALDLMALYRTLADGHGLPCNMHKDGLNAVLHCHEVNGRDGDAHSFFFSYGCVVTWGLSEDQERERLRLLATTGCAREPIAEHEVDDFGYTHVPGCKAALAKDVVTLATLDVREKLAVSFALAQSVKLGVFESTVELTIQETRSIPERMAKDGKIKLTRTSITKRIGQLFVDRASINLHSDILDHPEFFWEDDEWLPLYLRAAKYLEIDRRAEVLNKRLDIIKELFDMLASELHNSHSNKLEWIVIILIMIEVFFQVFQLVVEMAIGHS